MTGHRGAPLDWVAAKLADIAVLQTGMAKNSKNSSDGIEVPYLRVANVKDGSLDLSEVHSVLIPKEKIDRYTLKKNDLLLVEGNGNPAFLGRCAVWRGQIEGCIHQNHLFAVRAKKDVVDYRFLALQIQSPRGRYYLLAAAKSSSGLATLNSTQLKALPVLLPPLPEQTAIADLFSTWDEAIEKTEQLIEAKEKQYTHLVQELIHRVDARGEVGLRDIAKPITAKNTIGETNVLTSSAKHGLISQLDYYNKSVSAEDVSGYYLLERGDFAYNRSSSTGYPYGAIKRLDRHERGVLSTLYLCFRLTKTELVDSNYLADLFEAGVLNRQLRSICQAGGRSHGLLNVTKNDFFSLKIPLPGMAKQKEIAAKLELARKEIEVLEALLEKYKLQKRGLMQRLLTGEWRINKAKEVA